MNTPDWHLHIGIALLLLCMGCGDGFLPDAEDEKKEKSTSTDALETKDKDEQSPPENVTCDTLAAESFPMGIATTCNVANQVENTLEIALEYVPLESDKISVKIDDLVFTSFEFTAASNTIALSDLAEFGEAFVLKINYSSEVKYSDFVNPNVVSTGNTQSNTNCAGEAPGPDFECRMTSSGCLSGMDTGLPPVTSWVWRKKGTVEQCAPSAG